MMENNITNIFSGKKFAIFGSNKRTESIVSFLSKYDLDIVLIDDDKKIPNLTQFDLCVLAGWSKLIPKKDLEKPKYGFINCHAGKLPEYRGSSPMNWAILNNETKFGLSVITVDESFDTGEILVSREFDISKEHLIGDLHAIANKNFPEMVIEAVVKKFLKLPGYAQPSNGSSYYPLRSSEDGKIDWYLDDAESISRKIRALSEPYPGCFSFFEGKKVFFTKAISIDQSFSGEVAKIYKIKSNKILVSTIKGSISVEYKHEKNLLISRYSYFDK